MTEESLAPVPDAAIAIARPVSPARHLRAVLKSMRPRQWTKNGIVFMALIFSINQHWQVETPSSWDDKLLRAFITALAFCFASGAEYMINDVRDVAADRLHPRKRLRPIAAGLLSPSAATTWAVCLTAIAIAMAFAIDWRTGAVVVTYVASTLAYSYVLKHQVILDVMVIAAGFVLRAMAGAYAIDVPVSPWLYVVTALGALFLAITKRRAEVALLQDGASDHRATLGMYNVALLDQMTAMVTASTVIAYALYTFTAENMPANHTMMLTIPFVAYGIFRYLYLSLTRNEGGSPEEILLKDLPLLATVVLWVATSAAVLTAFR
jgi:4-hydroxybenzoate polyprenyltransferase